MGTTALDIPVLWSSFPISVRTTDVLVTSSVSTDKLGLGDDDEDMAGTAFKVSSGDAVSAGYIVCLMDTTNPEYNVDDDEDDNDDDDDDEGLGDTEVVSFRGNMDNREALTLSYGSSEVSEDWRS